jgi:hypothetical protein
MTAGFDLAGALSSATNVHIVAPSVYREVVAEVMTITAGPTRGPSSGSSWMTRKCHVQFLGGWGPAMAPGYPTNRILNMRNLSYKLIVLIGLIPARI